jgi:methylenetetrahydrofolate dehydrogenase (NAD+)
MGKKLLASTVAADYKEEITGFLQALPSNTQPPLLVGLLATSDPAAAQYAEWTKKAFEADGLRYETRTVDPIDVESALTNLNEDPDVHGIIVYYPIFGATPSYSGSSQDDYLRDSIAPSKDVEGLCHTYRTSLYRNVRYLDGPKNTKKCVLPCTALSVVKILESAGIYDSALPIGRRMQGKTVSIVNRSEIVGRPLAAMLANDGADVYSIDIDSIYLFRGGKLHKCDGETPESCVRKSSVVVSGVPVKAYKMPAEWIQPGTTFVNVASFKNIDADAVLAIEGTQYCGMVGKVTVAMLERNLCRLYAQYHSEESKKDQDVEVMLRKIRRVSNYTALGVALLVGGMVLSMLGARRKARW